MQKTWLDLPQEMYDNLHAHLFPGDFQEQQQEQVAFVFAKTAPEGEDLVFQAVDWLPIGADNLVYQSSFYIELADEVRARAIKQAHDFNASLIEFHCHCSTWPAEFSPSDLQGFEEFVPHVWWRLKGKPYVAVVVAPSSFDALVWVSDPKLPRTLDGIRTGSELLLPTGLTMQNRRTQDE